MDCCSKFDIQHIGKYHAPIDIWDVPDLQNARGTNSVASMLFTSVSGYVLAVISNIHDAVMSSRDYSFNSKVCIIITLSFATALAGIFAIAEAVVRLTILSILSLGGIYSAIFESSDALLRVQLGSMTYTVLQIPVAFYTSYLLLTKNSDINPTAWPLAIAGQCTRR